MLLSAYLRRFANSSARLHRSLAHLLSSSTPIMSESPSALQDTPLNDTTEIAKKPKRKSAGRFAPVEGGKRARTQLNRPEQENDGASAHERLGPKRKVALLMSFCGTGYQGMQINPNAKSIEGDLFSALIKAGCVSADNACDLKKIGFQRTARTDKGVHAAGQLVCAKLVIDHLEDSVAAINTHLPAQIRIWDVVRVMNGFSGKNFCDGRIYEFIMPTYVLEPLSDWAEKLKHATERPASLDASAFAIDSETVAVNRNYQVTGQVLEQFRDVLSGFVGTHNHHNFTAGRKFEDGSCKRYITSFTASDPETYYFTDSNQEKQSCGEWLSLKVKGQSFMLHQVRKMVGLAILIVKTKTPPSIQSAILNNPLKVNVPKAPSIGLLLERPLFDVYNKRCVDQDRPTIDFDRHAQAILEFKKEFIYDKVVHEEFKSKCFQVWLELLFRYPYQYRYLTADGKIPQDYAIGDHSPPQAVEQLEDEDNAAREDF